MFCYFSQFGLEKNCISLMILSLLPQKSCLYFPVFIPAGYLGRSFYNIFFLCPFSVLKCGCCDGLLHCSGTSLFPLNFERCKDQFIQVLSLLEMVEVGLSVCVS